jgi:hypothetical protein
MLRFRLRSLLIAVAIIAVPMAWVGYHYRWYQQRLAFMRDHGGTWARLTEPPGALRLFGDYGVESLNIEPGYANECKRLFPEADRIIEDPSWNPFAGSRR